MAYPETQGGGSVALNIIWQSIFSGKNYEKYLNFESVFRAAPLAKKFVRAHISNIKLDDGCQSMFFSN